MEMTVELSEAQERFLKLFAKNQAEGSEDNKGTRSPLHIVQKRYTKECAEEGEVVYYYSDVAYFWILEEARRYVQYQRHNLDHARIYTVAAGYGNEGEYEHFYSLLMKMGQQLLNEDW